MASAGMVANRVGVQRPAPKWDDLGVSVLKFGVRNDGGDYTDKLQKAFVEAAASGLPAVLPAWTIRRSGTLVADCSIIGMGPASRILNTVATGQNSLIDVTAKNDLIFKDFTVESLYSDGTGIDEFDCGLRVDQCFRVVVRGVRFINMNGTGLLVRKCRDVSIVNNIQSGCWKDGFHITGGPITGTGPNNITIQGNTVYDGGDDCIAIVGYQADAAPVSGVSVVGNVIHTSKSARGIAVVGGKNVTIGKNTIHRTKAAGIYIASEVSFLSRGVDNVIVEGNTLTECGNTSPDHASIMIAGAQGTGYPIKNVKIRGNTIERSVQEGIWVFGDTAAPAEDIELTDNTINDTTDPSGKAYSAGTGTRGGIRMSAYTKNFICRGNRVNETGGGGIFVEANATGIVRMQDNELSNINKNSAASTDAILIAAGSTADIIYVDGNRLGSSAYTVERLVECNNPSKTIWGKNFTNGSHGTVDGYTNIAYSATPTITCRDGAYTTIGALTGNITALTVTGPIVRDTMTILFTQDGTGGRTVTLGSTFKGPAVGSGTANQKCMIFMRFDGTNWYYTSSGWA